MLLLTIYLHGELTRLAAIPDEKIMGIGTTLGREAQGVDELQFRKLSSARAIIGNILEGPIPHQCLRMSCSYEYCDPGVKALRTYWHFGRVKRVLHHCVRVRFVHFLKHRVRESFVKRREQDRFRSCVDRSFFLRDDA
jgi:hypothetical protein